MLFFITLILALGLMGAAHILKGHLREVAKSQRTERMGRSLTREQAMQILGVPPAASDNDIRESYRRLVQKLHPDQGGSAYLMDLVVSAKNQLEQGK